VGCEMDSILEIGQKKNIPVIEDNAHGLFGSYKGRLLGTMGTFAALSFHETKNITCGEGGAIIINDASFCERAEIIREKGTNRSGFFRGEVDKYSWMDIGSSYLPSDILAAFLYAQLEDWALIQKRRKEIWDFYFEALSAWAEENGVRLPHIPTYCSQSYHMFYLVMPSPSHRDLLIKELKSRGIMSIFHYLPLHLARMGQRFGAVKGDCPITEKISRTLVRLPFHNSLRKEELDAIVKAISQLRF
jgi:dTDP-4-amino-4,6-dideoxygalactose transaminase